MKAEATRSPGGEPARPRLLLAEDYFAVADAYAGVLRKLGYEVVGPVSSVKRALALLEVEEVDGAVLDVALRGRVVTPVAERLRDMGRPFVFLTGMADLDLLPPHLLDAPTVHKPAGRDELSVALERTGLPGARKRDDG